MKRKKYKLRPIPRRPAFMLDCRNETLSNLKKYNPLLDRNLRSFFEIGQVQKRLVRAGLVQNDGTIIVRQRYQRGYRKKKCVGFRIRWSRIATVGNKDRQNGRRRIKIMNSTGTNNLRRYKLPVIKRKRPNNNPYKALQKKETVTKSQFQDELDQYKNKASNRKKAKKHTYKQERQYQQQEEEEVDIIAYDNPEELEEQNQAATKIQAKYKGNMARKKAKKQKEEKIHAEQDEAATMIQAKWKGNKARKEVKQKKADKKEHEEQDQAATKIQAKWKGNQARKEVEQKKKQKKEENEAATKIQAHYKGNQARKKVQKKKEEKEENEAATKIQARWKGNQARKEMQN